MDHGIFPGEVLVRCQRSSMNAYDEEKADGNQCLERELEHNG